MPSVRIQDDTDEPVRRGSKDWILYTVLGTVIVFFLFLAVIIFTTPTKTKVEIFQDKERGNVCYIVQGRDPYCMKDE